MLAQYFRTARDQFPRLSQWILKFTSRIVYEWYGTYPKTLAKEVRAVTEVLNHGKWNMAYGKGLAHERLEADFSEYVGVRNAVAVNTGGMALQMSMRALGLKPGHEVILQIDTCSATAFAVMNAGCTPIFSDISPHTFMLQESNLPQLIGPKTKAVIATHVWGNPEDLAAVGDVCNTSDLFLIEDACLALGTQHGGKMVGATGTVGVYSFGCLKPIQGGEGGMIVTNDDALARSLRSLRHWGDRTADFGTRDTIQLAWNGRMSEIIAAVVREQLKGYPRHLSDLREMVEEFSHFIETIDGLEIVTGASEQLCDCSFTQVVLRFDESALGFSKLKFREELLERGISTWHANFELINSLTFFREGHWQNWLPQRDSDRINENFSAAYLVAQDVFFNSGIGLPKAHFLSRMRLNDLKKQIKSVISDLQKHHHRITH